MPPVFVIYFSIVWTISAPTCKMPFSITPPASDFRRIGFRVWVAILNPALFETAHRFFVIAPYRLCAFWRRGHVMPPTGFVIAPYAVWLFRVFHRH